MIWALHLLNGLAGGAALNAGREDGLNQATVGTFLLTIVLATLAWFLSSGHGVYSLGLAVLDTAAGAALGMLIPVSMPDGWPPLKVVAPGVAGVMAVVSLVAGLFGAWSPA